MDCCHRVGTRTATGCVFGMGTRYWLDPAFLVRSAIDAVTASPDGRPVVVEWMTHTCWTTFSVRGTPTGTSPTGESYCDAA